MTRNPLVQEIKEGRVNSIWDDSFLGFVVRGSPYEKSYLFPLQGSLLPREAVWGTVYPQYIPHPSLALWGQLTHSSYPLAWVFSDKVLWEQFTHRVPIPSLGFPSKAVLGSHNNQWQFYTTAYQDSNLDLSGREGPRVSAGEVGNGRSINLPEIRALKHLGTGSWCKATHTVSLR